MHHDVTSRASVLLCAEILKDGGSVIIMNNGDYMTFLQVFSIMPKFSP